MLKGIFSWSSLPKYSYKSYDYLPDVDEDPDDGTRKIWHTVYYKGKQLSMKESPDWSPYEWPEEEDFKTWVDENYPE
jgi:hypothetical protein|tara:strand:- start:4369 stop:4599 length:231 start_codon:yes stop_codon:yes gene_type:complete